MFRAIFFAYLQERKTEIFTAYGIVSCCGRQGFGERQRGTTCTLHVVPRCRSPNSLPTTTTGHYTICCKNLSHTLLKMGKKDCPKHVELILEINKLLLLHLVGFSILLYLHDDARSNTNQMNRRVRNM